MSKPLRYLLASLIGAVAVPAAAVAVEFGAMMLLVGVLSAGLAAFGRSLYANGAEALVLPEFLVVLAGIAILVAMVELTRLLAGVSPRRRIYRRAIGVGALTAFGVFPVLGFAAYVSLHGRMEPGLPLGLIFIAVILHVGAGMIVWPVKVLRPEIRANLAPTVIDA